jgi:pilus assembly protein CpaF
MGARIFTFVGGKGGTGTTFTATEVAKALKDAEAITLVDGDLSGRRSAAILLHAVRALDTAHEAEGTVASVRINGVTLVELTKQYESAFTLSPHDIEKIAEIDAGIVLLDAPLPFSGTLRSLIQRTVKFFVVTEPSVLGVAASRALIAQMRRFGVPPERIVATISTHVPRPLSRSDVERALEVPVVAELPDCADRAFGRSIAALARAVAAEPPQALLTGLMPSDNGHIRERRITAMTTTGSLQFPRIGSNGRASAGESATETIKNEIHEALAKNIDLLDASKVQGDAAKLADMRARITNIAQDIITQWHLAGSAESFALLKQEVVNEALGLGPLETFMQDADITEIMVNGPSEIYVERHGLIERTNKRFANAKQLQLVIERIIAPLGRRLDESSPMVDARLPDGSRVNAIISPLSLNGATLTIRRFGTRRLTAADLLEKNSATDEMLDFLRACVEARLNIVISGGTGSGKTTFLNILSGYLPPRERIITIEDAAELYLNQPHVVRLESRPANLEGKGQIAIRDLVRNALRMRPDRVVIGECRGGEALDMLQAMNTGHDGSLTTVHANSPRDALSRIETMVLMAGFDLPVRAIREQTSGAIDLIIQTSRMRDGSRKVTSISEVVGMESDVITMQELVRFVQHGLDSDDRVRGSFEATGVQPLALRRFREYGVQFDPRSFASLPKVANLW